MLKHSFTYIVATLITTFLSLGGFAQTSASGFDEAMRSNDKIYVVMAVCLIILIAVFLYLIRIDIKVSKKEKNH